MTTKDKTFADQEIVRKARERNGREHDCIEAGCTLNPAGLPVTPGNAKKRPPLDQATLDAIARLRAAGVNI